MLNQVEVGFDAVSGENDITFEEYDQMTERNVDKFRAEAREFLVEKHGEIGGVVSDIFSGKVFGLSEVNSFRAVIFEEGALITGGNKKDSFVGSDASDHFLVSPGGDAILSLGGNDIFEMKAGYGGSKLSGGQGFDQLNVDGSSTSFQYVKGKTEGTLTGRDGSVAIADIERIHFSDKTLALDTESGQNAGQAYRVYQAAFARKPDAEGLTYWVNSLDKGSTLKDVANAFLESKEFMNTYGASPSNEAIVSKMYQNILGREPEAEGYNHWVGVLQRGAIDRGDLLSAFAESAENIKLVAPVLTSGVWLDA